MISGLDERIEPAYRSIKVQWMAQLDGEEAQKHEVDMKNPFAKREHGLIR